MAKFLPGTRFIGGHPLAGTELSGWRASDGTLFDTAPWSLTLDPPVDLDDWLGVARLVCDVGGHPVPTTAAEQDEAVARVIGLPHVLAETLARPALAGGPLGLSRWPRARTSPGRGWRGPGPISWPLWCDGNEALVVALDEVINRLDATRTALVEGRSVLPLAQDGHAARMNWEARAVRAVLVPADAEALLAHGRAGGWITAVGPDDLIHGMLPA